MCAELFSRMQFYPQRMLQNFGLSDGMITAERLMLELGRRGMGRDRAHHLVRDMCIEHSERLHHFREALRDYFGPSAKAIALKRSTKSMVNVRQATWRSPLHGQGGTTASGPPKMTPLSPEMSGTTSRHANVGHDSEAEPALRSSNIMNHKGCSTRVSWDSSPAQAGHRSTKGQQSVAQTCSKRRPRRRSLGDIKESTSSDTPQHPGSLAALVGNEPDVIHFLGKGDKSKAVAVAESLLDPQGYTGACSQLAEQASVRAKQSSSVLLNLSQRYAAISAKVMHGQGNRSTAAEVSRMLRETSAVAGSFQAIAESDELKSGLPSLNDLSVYSADSASPISPAK